MSVRVVTLPIFGGGDNCFGGHREFFQGCWDYVRISACCVFGFLGLCLDFWDFLGLFLKFVDIFLNFSRFLLEFIRFLPDFFWICS